MIYVTDVVVSGHSFSFWDVPTVRTIANCNLMKRWETWTTRNLVACSLPFLARVMIFRIVKGFAGLPNHVGKTGTPWNSMELLQTAWSDPVAPVVRNSACPLRWLCAGAGLSDAAWGAFQDERGRPGGLCKAVEPHWNILNPLQIFDDIFNFICSSL